MISHARFGKLRLAHFRSDAKIIKLDNWEFMDHLWVGEAVAFSEWLRLESNPEKLRSLAIDFSEFPEQAAAEVLRKIDLPIQGGMTFDELRQVLGKPVGEERFVNDRVTFEFLVPGPPRYSVSCTVLNKGGLTYLVVMTPLPRASQ